GHTMRSGTARALNELVERPLHRREWGRALEDLKRAESLPNDHHGAILDNGDYIDASTGEVLGNLLQFVPGG
ncbi:MAG: hypothetical protein K8H88_01100, partial [Sandaracinaceae bacterium]|nr:hypothetical protein [Sandaracinaceae bacterium]